MVVEGSRVLSPVLGTRKLLELISKKNRWSNYLFIGKGLEQQDIFLLMCVFGNKKLNVIKLYYRWNLSEYSLNRI